MWRNYVKNNILIISILLFICLFSIVQLMKPACFYNTDNSIREFGVGYKNKTIFPIWLFSLTLGILCYLAVNFYIITF